MMNTRFLSRYCCFFLFFFLSMPFMSSYVHAQALDSDKGIPLFLRQFGVSLESLSLYYFEVNDDASATRYVLDREKGIVPGLRFHGQNVWPGRVFTRLDLGVYKGELHYWGYLQDTATGDIVGEAKSSAQHTLVNLALDVGRYWPIRSHVGLIPYAQLGWWRWLRGVSPVEYVENLGVNGFDELYQHLYWGVGLRWIDTLSSGWVREYAVSAGQSWAAKMRTSVPFAVSADDAVLLQDDYRLGHRTQVQVGVRFSYLIDPHWATQLGIRYQYVNFARSAINVVGVSEPQSHTNRVLFALGVASTG